MSLKLHDYQIACKNKIENTNSLALFMDCGTGKTITVLKYLEENFKSLNHHMLLIAPKAIAISTWQSEMKKWNINIPYESLIINDKGKSISKRKRHQRYKEINKQKPKLWIINQDLLVDLIDNMAHDWRFKTIIIDEMQGFKSNKTQRFKSLKSVLHKIDKIIGLSGTPQSKGIIDLWSQIYLLDKGKRLGNTMTKYKETYFTPNPYVLVNGRPVIYEPKKGAEDIIYKKISDITFSVKNDKIKLPELIENEIIIEMNDDEYKEYKELIKQKVLAFDENGNKTNPTSDDVDHYVKAQNAGTLYFKLLQMASGALYKPQETWKDPKVPEYHKIHEHKVDHITHILNTTGDNVLIFYHFKSDLREITKRLIRDGYKDKIGEKKVYKIFDGSAKMQKEWNEGKINVLLLQPLSAGHGINIQDGGHTMIWYTSPSSPQLYIQAVARLYRQGQKHTTIVHKLIMKDTVDEIRIEKLKSKQESLNKLLEVVKLNIN